MFDLSQIFFIDLSFSTSSLAAWRNDLQKVQTHLAPGLRDVFSSLVEAAESSKVHFAKEPHST